MRSRWLGGAAAFLLLLTFSPLASAAPPTDRPDRASRPSVLVELAPGRSRLDLPAASKPVAGRWVEVPVPPGKSTEAWIDHLAGLPPVASVQGNRTYRSLGPPIVINDPGYPSQWHMADIGLPSALAVASGAGTVVAVVDTGVERGPDGFCLPFVADYDAVNNVSGPGAAFDVIGHGTFVAGVVAQCTGNGVGVAGVAPETRIMPVAVFFDNGDADSASVARGVEWARTHGANIINLSLGCDCPADGAVTEAISRAIAEGILVVAAAGNGGPVAYPANLPGVVAVSGTNRVRGLWSSSSTGPEIDLAAPAVDVYQESLSGYEVADGTSFAAPHVSGVLALLRSRGLSATRALLTLRCSAVDLGTGGRDSQFGHGLVSASNAVAGVKRAGCGRSLVSLVDAGGRWWQAQPDSAGQTPLSEFYFGNPGDVPFMGDWDCDGEDTPGLYRQSDGFVYLRDSNTQGVADIRFFFGNPSDVPVAGDFDGDGCDSVSIYRPSEGRFYIMNRLGANDGGLGAADYSYFFGNPGDKPFAGDFNGDGVDTVGLHRESTGLVYFRNSNTQGVAEFEFFWGDPGDRVFAADWDGNGVDSVGLFRPSASRFYFRLSNTQGVADWSFPLPAVGPPPAGGYLVAAGNG